MREEKLKIPPVFFKILSFFIFVLRVRFGTKKLKTLTKVLKVNIIKRIVWELLLKTLPIVSEIFNMNWLFKGKVQQNGSGQNSAHWIVHQKRGAEVF
jgi:hypothetical protein